MFGCIVAGRLVQTNIEQIDQTHFLFNLEDGAAINHIVIFLLPSNPFPEGFSATVHFQWQDGPFQLLGAIMNSKPSAIFRLRGQFPGSTPNPFVSSPSIKIGISVESTDLVQSQIERLQPPTSSTQTATRALTSISTSIPVIVERIVKNLYNYMTSFTTENLPEGTISLAMIDPNISYVPLRALKNWQERLLSRLNADPTFIERESD
ncbi:Protein OPI10 [Neolecta irregularis DAH-3]|uniref:Protein OPI10 n=1 Tax=Neolecta irregularis (strain DAH-3) TaxID=1198029 RepID=A0A1U7LGA4_NEOID|nr:Protein OPI10 [Neolecta irregularis DAH-3]|eukprot:OLL21685.1 Protein OPI10 [Neolecta irregularis DAH-3]